MIKNLEIWWFDPEPLPSTASDFVVGKKQYSITKVLVKKQIGYVGVALAETTHPKFKYVGGGYDENGNYYVFGSDNKEQAKKQLNKVIKRIKKMVTKEALEEDNGSW